VTVTSDEAQLRAVYAEHGRAMQLHATRLRGDRALAEDVVQEALIRLWRNREVVTNRKGSLRGWLLTVVHNIAIDRIRPAPDPVGFQNLAACVDLLFQAARSYSLIIPPRTGRRLIRWWWLRFGTG
jgi:DNA-directed RNA polymerase specialized sigma24 family protein